MGAFVFLAAAVFSPFTAFRSMLKSSIKILQSILVRKMEVISTAGTINLKIIKNVKGLNRRQDFRCFQSNPAGREFSPVNKRKAGI